LDGRVSFYYARALKNAFVSSAGVEACAFRRSLVYALINTFQDKPALFSSFLALKSSFFKVAATADAADIDFVLLFFSSLCRSSSSLRCS
jgi:hypothetical protein